MKNELLGIIVLCSLTVYSFGQNPFWVHQDKKIIEELNTVDKSRPNDVENYFIKQRKRPATKESLGFGWSISNLGVAGGYVSVSGTFIYHNDTIVSYSLYSGLPDETKLVRKYTDLFKGTFKVDSSGLKSLDYRETVLSKPLINYDGFLKSEDLSNDVFDYMSPHSGTMYGYSGGINGALLSNRRNFKRIKESLTPDIVYLLMYSINPASRLTAIEYYKKNPDKFENKDKIEAWINKVYKEPPRVQTLMGCISQTWDSWALVEFCLRIEEQ